MAQDAHEDHVVRRLTHSCGRFIGAVINQTVFVLCSRCKAFVTIVWETVQPQEETTTPED